MSHLSDTLNQLNKNNFSRRKISELAQASGHKLDHSTVSRYMAGNHPNPPKLKTLIALADALNVDIAKLERAADMPISQEPFVLPPAANTLSKKERDVILKMVEVLTDSKTQTPAPDFHPEQSGFDLAADKNNTSHARRRDYFDGLGEESQDLGE